MIRFQIVPFRPGLAQASSMSIPSPVPPPEPTFTGLPGVIESLAITAILSASAWSGIRVGMSASATPIKTAGWVGGLGSAIVALIYLGTKTGIIQDLGLPAIRVTPS